ncbi:hypothetical protein CA54_16820 [Symmachiella macrocystis]|uniref:Uncharacterized protein n=2 Tax=Symmachiella macrocystis TaxID=2527985 RepID=A0A5C6BNH0_9PLAN|nr:hypothetical protein CA54_16820 [Symmachiella macrocystis]
MAEGRQRATWDAVASVLCLLVNINRDPKSKPHKVTEFHPYAQAKKKPAAVIEKMSLKDCKGAFQAAGFK